MARIYVNHESDNSVTGWVTEGELTDLTVEVQWPGLPVAQTEQTARLIPLTTPDDDDSRDDIEVIGKRISRRQSYRGMRVQVQMYDGRAVHGSVIGWGPSVLQLDADMPEGADQANSWVELRAYQWRAVFELVPVIPTETDEDALPAEFDAPQDYVGTSLDW